MFFLRQAFVLTIFLFCLVLFPVVNAIRSFPAPGDETSYKFHEISTQFLEAPEYQNAPECTVLPRSISACNPSLIHIAMTIDLEYLRGTIASVHSVIKHTSCPENIFFHFMSSDKSSIDQNGVASIVRSAFPSLHFKAYTFRESLVTGLVSSSIRRALENPLNYARTYLADILEPCIHRVIYLDSDTIVVDDIKNLWNTPLTGSKTIGAPEYCHVNFTKYFTNEFWLDKELPRVFLGKRPCYFNTGVMVMDLERWREGNYGKEIEKWMRVQKERRIYELGSLPPFLLVFGGKVEGIDHRWNQHGLGGDNVVNSCRSLHRGEVSLMHWSGKGKPWVRLDEGKACPVDYLWAPYDLYTSRKHSQNLFQGQ